MDNIVNIDNTLCNGCEKCIHVCEFSVLYMDDFSGLCRARHQELCDRKGACVKVCPTGAIKIDQSAPHN